MRIIRNMSLDSLYFMYCWNHLTIVNGHINLYTGFNRDGSDLLDDFRRGVQVDQTLVDTHFELIPSVGTFTGRGLTSGNTQALGGHTDRTRNMQLLVDGTLLQVGTDLLEVLHVAASQRDTDAVDDGILSGSDVLLDGGNVRHDVFWFYYLTSTERERKRESEFREYNEARCNIFISIPESSERIVDTAMVTYLKQSEK
jgi:hypothetical protein